MTEQQTLTLADFLLARYAEDEADWRAVDAREVAELLHGKPIAPKMLADIEAKRALIEADYEYAAMLDGERCVHSAEQIRAGDCPSVPPEWWAFNQKIMATVYADHPDYREEWRP